MSAIGKLSRYFGSHPLTRSAPLDAWLRFVSWQIRSRLRDEVVVSWIGGQRLAARRGMAGATGNIYTGLHEFTDMMLVLHLLQPGDLFLDVGANVGCYTVLASGVRKAATWAFEPAPETVRSLHRNIEINGLRNRVVVHATALGEFDGEVAFTRGMETENRVAAEGESNVRMVAMHRLDTLLGPARPLMMKMDVEGYEQSVVRGAQELLARNCLQAIILESYTVEVEASLHQHGFARAYYDPFRRLLMRTPCEIPPSNAVFVRDWQIVTDRLRSAPAVDILDRTI
jgi:FkbM family methyltransferase